MHPSGPPGGSSGHGGSVRSLAPASLVDASVTCAAGGASVATPFENGAELERHELEARQMASHELRSHRGSRFGERSLTLEWDHDARSATRGRSARLTGRLGGRSHMTQRSHLGLLAPNQRCTRTFESIRSMARAHEDRDACSRWSSAKRDTRGDVQTSTAASAPTSAFG